jgi:fibro-slime domain-containing protein
VWVFINDQLAVDLGGIHQAQYGHVDLDTSAAALGIEKGLVYDLDLFQAERHTISSDFRIDTDLAFVNCGIVEPEVVK